MRRIQKGRGLSWPSSIRSLKIERLEMPKSKYSAKQRRLAAIAAPRDRITGADLKALRKRKKKGQKK